MFGRNEINPDARPPARARFAWHEMEEYQPNGGMWVTAPVDSRAGFIADAAALMRDSRAFLAAMVNASARWPRSTAQALTTPGLNQRAWIGHAGCYIATGSPEETTRLGWHELTDDEQRCANAAADQAIAVWALAQTVQPTLFGGDHA